MTPCSVVVGLFCNHSFVTYSFRKFVDVRCSFIFNEMSHLFSFFFCMFLSLRLLATCKSVCSAYRLFISGDSPFTDLHKGVIIKYL
jgi:hypothetical protein